MARALQDSLTLQERNLLALGEYARVREQRTLLGLSFEDQRRSEIERILRRRIAASTFGFDPRNDLAAEIFTLEPSAEADHGRDDQSPGTGNGNGYGALDLARHDQVRQAQQAAQNAEQVPLPQTLLADLHNRSALEGNR